jgi:hypothetical protein
MHQAGGGDGWNNRSKAAHFTALGGRHGLAQVFRGKGGQGR